MLDAKGTNEELDEMLRTERSASATMYPRWPTQGTVCTSRGVDSPSPVTSSLDGDQTRDYDSGDLPPRRSSGSSFEESDSDVEVIYTCPCGKRFNRAAPYKRHLDVAHSNTESHKCSVCGKTFGNERTLTMHMSVHQDSKQFSSTLERCSKSRSSSRSRREANLVSQVEKIKSVNHVVCVNKDSADPNVSITPVSGSNFKSDEVPPSQDHFVLSEVTPSSEDDWVGTDKENCSPQHESSGNCSDTSDTLSTDSISVPPLVNGHTNNNNLELDLTLPKSKPEDDTIITSNGSVAQSSIISRYSESRNVSGLEPNKVSVITIKTDRSLLSESVLLRTKGGKSGDFIVNPAGHSVIVIKTQETKNKISVTNTKSDTNPSGNKTPSTHNTIDVETVRKSRRLEGKVPGWKHILVDKSDISSGVEGRTKRRKMAKVKIEDTSNDMMETSMATDLLNLDDKHRMEPVFKRAKMNSPVYACPDIGKTGIFKCPICEKSFESEKYLSMHMSLHKVDNSMESLMSQNNKEDELENNNVSINIKAGQLAPNGAFWTCKICSKVFAQNSNYKNHIRTHSDERPFVCQICSIGFKERYHLKKHMLFKHSDELKEECRFCGKKFKDSTAVRAHERIHSDDRPYSCRRCGKSFKTSECLWHHENRSKTCGQALLGLPSPGPRFKRGRQPKKEIKVEKNCLAGIAVIPVTSNNQHLFPREQLLLSGTQQVVHPHVPTTQTHFNEVAAATASIQSPQPADLVPTTMLPHQPLVKFNYQSSVATANSHIATVPNVNITAPNVLVSSPATTAVAQFPAVQSMPSFALPNCPAVMVKVEPEAALPDYELTAMASSEGSFEDTNSDLLTKDDPEMHSASLIESESGIGDISHETIMQVQEEIKKDPMLEDIGMLLLEKSVGAQELIEDGVDDMMEEDDEDTEEEMPIAYTGAERSSTDSRFSCDKCGKNFVSAPAFDKHVLTHSGLRPYICVLCGVGFKLKVHLKKHCLYRHSDEKPCECRICGKKFKDSSAVRLHERIHSNDRPFHCECGKTFKTRENLWGHKHRGPCETKVKYVVDAANSTSASLVTTCNDTMESYNGPVVARAQLGDTHVSAQAAILNNQIIARAVVSNKNVTAEAFIGNNGEVKASASISGADRKAESTLHPQEHFVTAQEPTALPRTTTPMSTGNIQRNEVAPVIVQKTVESRVNLPVLSTSIPSTGVPTAVVAPLMRQTPPIPVTASAISPQSILKPVKLPQKAPKLTESVQGEEPDKTESATLPPFETFSPKLRGNAPTLADRCPTIQKYLQMSRQPIKLPGIQQLFQTHSLAHGLQPLNSTSLESQNQNLLSVRKTDPSAPLGPHPTQQIDSCKSPNPAQSPVLPVSQMLTLPHPLLMGQTGLAKPAPSTLSVMPNTVPTSVVTARLTPTAQVIRSTSPYPGVYGLPGLPLLLPSDPNLASTSGEGLTAQSPAETPVTSASTPVYWEYETDKKSGTASVWHSEQEQLFQDLTQTTAFSQL